MGRRGGRGVGMGTGGGGYVQWTGIYGQKLVKCCSSSIICLFILFTHFFLSSLQILTSLENQRVELENLRRQTTAAVSSDKEKQVKKESKSGIGTGKGRGGGGKKKQKNKGAKGTEEKKGEEEAVAGGPTIRPDDDALAETQV
jgi:hypothetical protein